MVTACRACAGGLNLSLSFLLSFPLSFPRSFPLSPSGLIPPLRITPRGAEQIHLRANRPHPCEYPFQFIGGEGQLGGAEEQHLWRHFARVRAARVLAPLMIVGKAE